jgi:hypothetical protein
MRRKSGAFRLHPAFCLVTLSFVKRLLAHHRPDSIPGLFRRERTVSRFFTTFRRRAAGTTKTLTLRLLGKAGARKKFAEIFRGFSGSKNRPKTHFLLVPQQTPALRLPTFPTHPRDPMLSASEPSCAPLSPALWEGARPCSAILVHSGNDFSHMTHNLLAFNGLQYSHTAARFAGSALASGGFRRRAIFLTGSVF